MVKSCEKHFDSLLPVIMAALNFLNAEIGLPKKIHIAMFAFNYTCSMLSIHFDISETPILKNLLHSIASIHFGF